MRDTDWKIRRRGRAWRGDELGQRIELRPEKLEIWKGRLFFSDRDRIAMLGLLLENVGIDGAIRLGNPQLWREAIDDLTSPEIDPDRR